MPDFDPDNVPILDDIIDDDGTDANELDNSENEDNLDLFEENETELASETESQIETADNHDDDEDTSNERVSQLSIQHNYEEIYSGLAFHLGIAVKDAQPENTVQDETDSLAAIEPLELEPIVKSVVKQMMPDLEQQLRFLIQQALEERLPPDIIQLTSKKTDDK